MNWYIAICSLVTGFALGAVCFKSHVLRVIRDQQQEFLTAFIKHAEGHNKQLGELFNINRQILIALVKKSTLGDGS